MKRIIITTLLFAMACLYSAAVRPADSTPPSSAVAESRLVVLADVENVRQSMPGPLKEPLIGFLEELRDEVVLDLYSSNVYAAKVPEELGQQLAVVFNAANANHFVRITIAAGPDPLADPHFLVHMQLVGVERKPEHTPSRPAYTVSATLWEHTYRLGTKDSLSGSAKNFGQDAATQIVARLKQ